MRLALLATTGVGWRCARALLGERSLTALGLIGRRPAEDDPRLVRAEGDLSGWDALITDDAPRGLDLASRWGIAVVVPSLDPELLERAGLAPVPVLAGCEPGPGLASVLLEHQAAASGEMLEGLLAWTETGRRLRKGEAVPFPDPVGPLWARPVQTPVLEQATRTRTLAAPTDGEWMGATARITTATADGVVTRTLGVADRPDYLAAITLAAGALALVDQPDDPGLRLPSHMADAYLDRALSLGLGVAAFTDREPAPDRSGEP